MQDNILTGMRLRMDDLITTSTKQTPHPTPIGVYTTPRHASHHYGCWRLGSVAVSDLQAMLHTRLLMVCRQSNVFLSYNRRRQRLTLIGAVKKPTPGYKILLCRPDRLGNPLPVSFASSYPRTCSVNPQTPHQLVYYVWSSP
jgi:hypothetical protein